MARTFRATLTVSDVGRQQHGRVPLDTDIVAELGLMPGESLRAQMRGTEFTAKVLGSMTAPGLMVPMEVIRNLGLREGQGVRVTVIGRA